MIMSEIRLKNKVTMKIYINTFINISVQCLNVH